MFLGGLFVINQIFCVEILDYVGIIQEN